MTRVRPGRPADRERLGRAQAALAEPAPELLDAILDPGGPGQALVAVADGDPVGYLLALPGPDAVYVPELAVRPDRQREGHGSALVSALVSDTGREIRLTVAAGNGAARRFYARHGFEAVERVPERFETGDGVVLVRPPPAESGREP